MAKVNFAGSGFLFLYFSVFIAFLNSALNGFDNSLMSGIIIMPGFIADFGDLSSKTNPAMNGLLFSLMQLGAIAMSFGVGPINDKFGRRAGMIVGSTLIIVGTILEISTTIVALFSIGRLLIGAGICCSVVSAPTYVVEIAHPVFRGRATAMYNSGWNVGSVPASLILYGIAASAGGGAGSSSWQIPCGLQASWSVVVLIGCFFIPESPRWLVSVGKTDAARDFLTKYHAAGDADALIVSEQLKEIELAIETERSQNQGSFAALFNNRPNRLRSFIVIGVGFFSQAAGNWIAGYFQSQILPYFGVTQPSQILLLGVITNLVSLTFSFIGSALVDKFGRRPYLVYGTFLYCFFFTLLTILLAIYNQNEITNDPQGPQAVGITAFIVLQIFGICYSICWTSLNALYPVEVLSYSTRAKGMSMCQMMINIANIIQSFVLSYGLNAYTWKFFSFYILFNAFALVMIYLYFPETKGRTLEEIDEIFQAPNPVKKSLEAPEKSFDDLLVAKEKAVV
jgi:sugar porter (SP) family MFS transporter